MCCLWKVRDTFHEAFLRLSVGYSINDEKMVHYFSATEKILIRKWFTGLMWIIGIEQPDYAAREPTVWR